MGRLAEALKASPFVITGELTPPKGTDLGDLFTKAELLREHVTAFNLTESHAARMAMDPVAVGHLLLDRGGEPIVQMTSRDKNRLAIQASILGAAALGISNVVFMGGDPPKNGDHPDAKPVFDLFASQLLEAASALNAGNDLTGNPLKGVPQLTIGAVANPGANDIDTEIDNMKRKADAGAEFFQTQAVYDIETFGRFMDRAKPDKPVLAGIIPIKSVKMAQYMNDRIPGVDIPQQLIDRIDSAGDDQAQITEISIEIASTTVRALRSMTGGVHVMAIGWEDKVPAILDRSSA